MHYEKGPLAFFDGTRSDYRKVLKPEDTIAGFKVTEIDSSKVKLTGPTNEIELRIGMQLKHDNDSGWVPSERPESAEPSPGYSTTSHLSFTTVSNADKSGETQNGAPEGEFPPINLDAAQIFGGEPPGQPGSTNAAPAAPPIDGVTDPVLLRLMQRRAQERGE
ncbi:MAG TPA: hypothetical protein VLT36_13405 [Candidatus Dormibacteraeota bacterium]|nr:hypothetical protein [Candidatus Dormibacteraeota bacterium]